MLLAGCREDEARRIDGRAQTVGEALAIERQHLLPLAREGFDLVEVSFGQVNGLGCVKARTNAYSTPLAPGTKAQIKLTATTVEVWSTGGVRQTGACSCPGADRDDHRLCDSRSIDQRLAVQLAAVLARRDALEKEIEEGFFALPRTYYDRKRAQGKRHNQAVLCLARRRVDVLHAMLSQGVPYRAPASLAIAA